MTPSFIQRNVPLAPYTTLGVGGPAEYFCEIHDTAALRAAVSWAKKFEHKITILGGGSNVLVPDEGVAGLTIHMCTSAIVYEECDALVRVRVDAGVLLDTFVAEAVARGLWGVENLSAIPGTIGAVPVQNVGAYGVEGKDIIESVEVYDIETDATRIYTNAACQFGYRDSLFKKSAGSELIILSVTCVLTREPNHKLTYKDLKEYFGANETPSLIEIRNAVIEIRSKKFPDWHITGTAGSFFKNPHVSAKKYGALRAAFPLLPGFPDGEGMVKVSLGWILDHVLGMKGYRKGNVGLFVGQALVLVCYDGATAREISAFSQEVIAAVKNKTGMMIECEVRMIR
jgi:UDP-N-acetylmuramate dehydrogenase